MTTKKMTTTIRPMKIEALAKINLTLEVLGKRVDGYHALRSIVQPVTLADELEIVPTDDGRVVTDTGYGEDDLIVKAARVLGTAFGLSCPCGVSVRVTKRIPAGGGLGGGSADAAAMLRALNDLWHLGRTPEELATIGADVGSDVPALVLAQHYRRPVLMEGRGEKVALLSGPAPVPSGTPLVLANPGVHASTPAVFRAFVRTTYPTPANDLQEPAVRLYPEIGVALRRLAAAGAREVAMTGSGATVFGFAADADEARRIVDALAREGLSAWAVKTA